MPLRPPRPSLPSLNSLRAFEAAARHRSFVKAGEELSVSAGAISRHIKQLEEWAGCALFHRLPHGLRLTTEAEIALPEMIEAFDTLGLAARRLRSHRRSKCVEIAALPAIASLWLAPRLPKLQSVFPDAQIFISALDEPPHFSRDLYDVGLFFLEHSRTGVEATVLGEDELFPVCAPQLLTSGPPLSKPSDLAQHTLLHDRAWRDDWARWLQAAGAMDVDPLRGPTFSLYSLAFQAAVDGNGILMGRRTLVADALHQGRLVAPFRECLQARDRLMLLLPQCPTPPISSRALVSCLLGARATLS